MQTSVLKKEYTKRRVSLESLRYVRWWCEALWGRARRVAVREYQHINELIIRSDHHQYHCEVLVLLKYLDYQILFHRTLMSRSGGIPTEP